MLIFKSFIFLLKVSFLLLLIIVRYFLILLTRLFYFLLFFPVSLFSVIKSLLFFIIKFTKHYFNKFKSFLLLNLIKLNNIYVVESFYQFLQHLYCLGVLKEKIFRRFYFYRRSYYVSGRSFKFLLKAV